MATKAAELVEKMVAEAIEVTSKTKINNGYGYVETLDIQIPSKKVFNFKGDSIAFTYENSLYVLPFHEEIYPEILEEAGYKRDVSFDVPLSSGISFPVEEKERWMELMEKSKC